ncbi:MAG: M15 family metallopeptidase, partial [Clostridia bacterium]
ICVLAIRTYENITGEPYPISTDESPFTDTDSPSVVAAAQLGLISGREPFIFDGQAGITRQESAKLFVELARKLDLEPDGDEQNFYDIWSVAPWAVDYVKLSSAYGYLTADYKGDFLPENQLTVEQAVAVFVRIYLDALPETKTNVKGSGLKLKPTLSSRTGTYEYDGSYKKNDPDSVFTEGEITTKEQADSQMCEITVDIWELKNGEKVSGTMTLTIHKNIAEIVKDVFDDIYNGSEKFPIDKAGTYGYYFRTTAGTNRLSEHATGTAIDINPDQNYCVYSDGSTVGSLYAPGENPYSIQKFGDCWNAFVTHGFTWGGDAWDSPKDYMHFSYLGK